MAGSLFDSNVWVAAVFPKHPSNHKALEALEESTPSNPAIFCRSTQQSFLRLASTPALLKAYGADRLSNRGVLELLDALLLLPQVCEREEPPGMSALWHRLATRDTASPKVWMDAYLAAFAITGGLQMVTFDHDFKNVESQGLDLRLLSF